MQTLQNGGNFPDCARRPIGARNIYESDRYLELEVAQPVIPPAEDRVQAYLVGVYAYAFRPEAP